MSKKDDFWDDIEDYIFNPHNEARQFEDYIEGEEKNEYEYYDEQLEDYDIYDYSDAEDDEYGDE